MKKNVRNANKKNEDKINAKKNTNIKKNVKTSNEVSRVSGFVFLSLGVRGQTGGSCSFSNNLVHVYSL